MGRWLLLGLGRFRETPFPVNPVRVYRLILVIRMFQPNDIVDSFSMSLIENIVLSMGVRVFSSRVLQNPLRCLHVDVPTLDVVACVLHNMFSYSIRIPCFVSCLVRILHI